MAFQDVSAFGVKVIITADKTLPMGVTISEFGESADPISVQDVTMAESEMGVNGDLILTRRARPISITLPVVPGTAGSEALRTLWEANRFAKNKNAVRDVITMVIMYPNDKKITLVDGAIVSGPPIIGVNSAGRLMDESFGFVFANVVIA